MNKHKAIEWLFIGDTGTSPKTMHAAILGEEYKNNAVSIVSINLSD
jgi:hypothetical protein